LFGQGVQKGRINSEVVNRPAVSRIVAESSRSNLDQTSAWKLASGNSHVGISLSQNDLNGDSVRR
jgi:hypothetical protein